MLNKILLVIPTFNEEKNIILITNKLLKLYKNIKILVVDDSNSSFKRPKNLNKKVSFIHRKNQKGRCSAVLYGFKIGLKKKFNIFIEMDADFSHNPNELKEKIEYFNKHEVDMLIASRYTKNSRIMNWSIFRRIFSLLSNFLARLLLKIPCTDYTNGFRFYSKRAAEKVVNECGKIGGGFIVLSEILVVMHSNNFKIDELNTIFVNRKRGESSVSLKLIFSSLLGLIKLYYLKKNKHGK